jgi:5-methylcytosine-specific restriction endonuclease McrA
VCNPTYAAWYGVDFNVCDGITFKVFHRFTQFTTRAIMPNHKSGQMFNCIVCQKPFYRRRHEIAYDIKKSCSLKCSGIARSGENNPFWGKTHSPENRQKISAGVRANPSKTHGPIKGSFKHTEEAKAKMSAALRERWQKNRVDMISYSKRGQNTPRDALMNGPRHQFIFTKTQKREWLGTSCAYCTALDDLVIDHIIPVICGGHNERSNAQTLCQTCNRWKMRYVDLPLYTAILGSERGIKS